jgi:HK97 gp10 family phage protein
VDFSADTAQLDILAADFTRRGLMAGVNVYRVTERAARNVKETARQELSGSTRMPHLARTITYDIDIQGTQIVAEVGPERGGQGSLGHIREYGTATASPQPFMAPAFDKEVPNWLDHLGRVG